jgi:hypothetical protein
MGRQSARVRFLRQLRPRRQLRQLRRLRPLRFRQHLCLLRRL